MPTNPNNRNRNTDNANLDNDNKQLALSQLASPAQRRLVEAIADSQALPDDHPAWAIVAMVMAAIGPIAISSNSSDLNGTDSLAIRIDRLASETAQLKSEIADLKAQVSQITQQMTRIEEILSAAAHLTKGMPKFQQQLGEAIGTVLQRIGSLDSKAPRPK